MSIIDSCYTPVLNRCFSVNMQFIIVSYLKLCLLSCLYDYIVESREVVFRLLDYCIKTNAWNLWFNLLVNPKSDKHLISP